MTNLITKKGCCGRLISIVTDWETEPTVKDYTGLLRLLRRLRSLLQHMSRRRHRKLRQKYSGML